MEKKKLVAIIVAAVLAAGCAVCFYHNENKNDRTDNRIESTTKNKKSLKPAEKLKKEEKIITKKEASNKEKIHKAALKEENSIIRKTNLFNTDAGSTLPLSAISVLSSLPHTIQNKVEKISESNNIFMVQKYHDKLLIITDNPENIRHCVEFTEISIPTGQQRKTTLGYNDKIKDSDNDIWDYDEQSKLPIRHTKYNSNGDVEFVELWNYDNNPIKYEMKDADGHVISVRKETLNNGTDLRVEHLVYDKEGNTRINVSATYDGEDVKRFTYYNAEKPAESGSVFSEYSNGLKTKETVYTSDLKLKNSYTSEYKNGEREEISVWDTNNNEIQKLVPADTGENL